MTQNTDTPKPTIPPLPEQLKIHLEHSLSRYGEQDDEALMYEQIQILDRAFRCVTERAVCGKADTHALIAALKAQQQCRQTMKQLNRLENNSSYRKPQK